MSNNFVGFVLESTKLHQDAFSEQIRISEDVNKYSTWFLGLSTAGVALLIARFESIVTKSWISADWIKTYLIIIGVLFLISITIGIAHNYLSIKERNCYRIMISMLGPLRLLPFIKPLENSYDSIPNDLHNLISRGELLDKNRAPKYKATQVAGIQLRKYLSALLTAQQALAGISYILFFAASITK